MPSVDIYIEKLGSSNWREAVEVRPSPGQLHFVADYEPVALVILSKSYVRPGGLLWEPFGIRNGDEMVGVFALAHNRSTCRLHHLLIDQAEQGNGLGAAALQAIVSYIKQKLPHCPELTLTVNPNNGIACSLYRSAKFERTEETRDGEPVWRLEIDP